MKEISGVFIIALVFSCLAGGTTEEEYNFLTKGYKVQVESGLDMKKGYKLDSLTENFAGSIKIKTFALIRDGEQKSCANLLVLTNSETWGGPSTMYFCLPSADADKALWDKFYKAATECGSQYENVILWGLAKLCAVKSK